MRTPLTLAPSWSFTPVLNAAMALRGLRNWLMPGLHAPLACGTGVQSIRNVIQIPIAAIRTWWPKNSNAKRSGGRSQTTWMGQLRPLFVSRWTSTLLNAGAAGAVLDGTRNVVQLAGDPRAFPVPAGVSERLRAGLEQSFELIPMGITNDRVPLGSHLIYFWDSDDDFKRGVKFLNPGLGQGDHCIVFGHDEAIEKVLDCLAADGFNTERLIKNLQLTVLPRRKSAQNTLDDIGDVVQAALRAGAKAVRFLGNLGMGRDPLPAGEDDVL